MAMDWISFLQQHRIDYVERGPNVARGNANIACVFCGDDPSHHMGLNLSNGYWGCWRDPQHRGRSPIRLVRALIGCSYERALQIVGAVGPRGTIDQVLAGLVGSSYDRVMARRASLKMPVEFKVISQRPGTRKYWRYLRDRNFDERDVDDVVARFDLRACHTGPFADRVIIPIYQGGLVGWTGRTITRSPFRYKSLSDDADRTEGYPPAALNIKHTLPWYEQLLHSGGDTLVIFEGPFDAIKVDFYGATYGVRATCLWNVGLEWEQANLLAGLRPKFRRLVSLFDAGAFHLALRAAARTADLGVEALPPIEGYKDAGEMFPEDARRFCQQLVGASKNEQGSKAKGSKILSGL